MELNKEHFLVFFGGMCLAALHAGSQKEKDETFCLTVNIVENSKNPSIKLETVRDMLIRFLLGAVIKGFMEIRKVDVLWNDRPRIPKPHNRPLLESIHDSKFLVPVNAYNFLGSQIGSDEEDTEFKVSSIRSYKSDRCAPQFAYKFGAYKTKGFNKLESLWRSFLRSLLTYDDIQRLSHVLRKILNKYPVKHQLNEADRSALMMALYFRPRRDKKIGVGAQEIKVANHPRYNDSKCFSLVRTDGTIEDFSSHKCIHGRAEMYHEKHLKARIKD